MSADKRKEIAVRHADRLANLFNGDMSGGKHIVDYFHAAMREYAALVLEEVARDDFIDKDAYGQPYEWDTVTVRLMLLARAAEERKG